MSRTLYTRTGSIHVSRFPTFQTGQQRPQNALLLRVLDLRRQDVRQVLGLRHSSLKMLVDAWFVLLHTYLVI